MSTTVTKVTNTEIYNVLLDLREDIGGLKTAASTQLKSSEDHAVRIAGLEGSSQRLKGAVKAWGLVATGLATGISAIAAVLKH